MKKINPKEIISKRLACHSAVRAGDSLTNEECHKLISDLEKTDQAAADVIAGIRPELRYQDRDNLNWVKDALKRNSKGTEWIINDIEFDNEISESRFSKALLRK